MGEEGFGGVLVVGGGFDDALIALVVVVDVGEVLRVPVAATSCRILLVSGVTGVAFDFEAFVAEAVVVLDFLLAVALATVFFAPVVVAAFAVVAFVDVAFAAFLTVSPSLFALFVAFVDAFLVVVFFTSSALGSTTFLGRPRFFGAGSVGAAGVSDCAGASVAGEVAILVQLEFRDSFEMFATEKRGTEED